MIKLSDSLNRIPNFQLTADFCLHLHGGTKSMKKINIFALSGIIKHTKQENMFQTGYNYDTYEY